MAVPRDAPGRDSAAALPEAAVRLQVTLAKLPKPNWAKGSMGRAVGSVLVQVNSEWIPGFHVDIPWNRLDLSCGPR